jgi:hypothetical protein
MCVFAGGVTVALVIVSAVVVAMVKSSWVKASFLSNVISTVAVLDLTLLMSRT